MPVTYEQLMALEARDIPSSYGERDTLLYAVSTGMGRDPLNERELDFLFEKRALKVVPTQAITASEIGLVFDIGMHVEKFLHGGMCVSFHKPLPVAANLLTDQRVTEVYDKGLDKGCVVEITGKVRERDTGEPMFDWVSLFFCRGDGGVGGPGGKVPRPHPIPERAPDLVRSLQTRPEQALLYRLNGDRNLVHVDPRVAGDVGFPRPILHGACTEAFACREILAGVCGYDPTMIRAFDVRYSSPVFPGETIETSIWVDGVTVSFRCRVVERDVIVIDHGRCALSRPPAVFARSAAQ